MRENFNNIWPKPKLRKKNLNKNFNLKLRKNKLNKIENYFSDQFGYHSKLFPSGRACLGVIFRYLNLDKDKYVFLNKWSSNSLISSVGHYCNISSNFKDSSVIINNHQWGEENRLKVRDKIIIEDSCDSIILNKKTLFINNSKFEFFSLPKIIGSFSGGIVISKDKKFLKFCNYEQRKNIEFGISQFKSKLKNIKKNYLKDTNFWFNEVHNTYCDYNSLEDIDANLKNYEYNKNKIQKRLIILKKLFNTKITGRIGPVFPIQLKKLKNVKKIKKMFLIRNKISKNNMSKFHKCVLVPVHFNITDNQFKKFLNILIKNLKK